MQYWTTFTPSCTWSLKASPNICPMIRGLGTFGHIISNYIRDLVLNPLLLFHHVVQIPKYLFFELR
jgi:hypothetical protein